NAKDLALVEIARQLMVDLGRTGKVAADRLFDHDPRKPSAAIGRANQPGLRQAGRALINKLRWNSKIKDVTAAGTELTIDCGKPLLDSLIIGRFRETRSEEHTSE